MAPNEMVGHISQRPWTPTKRRGPIAAEFVGPGPAWVTLPSLIGKASAPSSSLHYRHAEPKPFITPAPGSYCPEKADDSVQHSAAKFSFGHRTNMDIKNNTPAPNVYNVPAVLGTGGCPEGTKQRAPAYSMPGRGKDQVDFRAANPGPGKYESGNMNMVRSKAPSYSLSVRTVLPSDDTKKPGPGAHSPEKVNMSPGPALTFGIKHSPYTAPIKNGGW